MVSLVSSNIQAKSPSQVDDLRGGVGDGVMGGATEEAFPESTVCVAAVAAGPKAAYQGAERFSNKWGLGHFHLVLLSSACDKEGS